MCELVALLDQLLVFQLATLAGMLLARFSRVRSRSLARAALSLS